MLRLFNWRAAGELSQALRDRLAWAAMEFRVWISCFKAWGSCFSPGWAMAGAARQAAATARNLVSWTILNKVKLYRQFLEDWTSWLREPGFISLRNNFVLPGRVFFWNGNSTFNERDSRPIRIFNGLDLSGSKSGASPTQACLAPRQPFTKTDGGKSVLHELILLRKDRPGLTNGRPLIGNKSPAFLI